MRSGIFILALILTGCKSEPPSSASGVFAEYCDIKARWRVEKQIFHLIDRTKITTAGGDTMHLTYLRRDTSYYVVSGSDTVTHPNWGQWSFLKSSQNDAEHPYGETLKIYQEFELAEVMKQNVQSDFPLNILFNSNHGNDTYIVAATTWKTQLDHDIELEALICRYRGWYCQYYIFDDALTGWKYHGQLEFQNRREPIFADTSLRGYFGLNSSMGGTGLSSNDMQYFCLTPDSIAYCFAINYEYHAWMPFPGRTRENYMDSYGHGRLLNDSTVEVTHHTSFRLTRSLDDDQTAFRHRQFVRFHYHRSTSDSAWTPDPGHKGFYSGGELRLTFMPEVEMMFELYRLKESGTKNQKYFLRDLEVEADPYFR